MEVRTVTSAQDQAELTAFGGGGGGGGFNPFQRELQLHFGAGASQITGTFTVPKGTYLVIETVTADLGVGDREQPFLFVTTVVNGVTSQHTIALKELPRSPNVFNATHNLRLYADPGSTVTVMVTRVSSLPLLAIPKPELVTLSGQTIL
jgi:hypothetical protein